MAQRRKAILETPNRRKRKRQRKIRIAILLFIFAAIIGAAIFYFFRIPALQVCNISVIGAGKIDPTLIKAEAEEVASGERFFFIPKHFVLFYPAQEIEQRILESHKDIESAEVRIRGANRAEIRIVERSPHAAYCAVFCFYLDAGGLAYEESTTTENYVVFRDMRAEYQASSSIGAYPLKTETFNEMVAFARRLSEVGLHLSEVVIESSDSMSVITEEGKLIVSAKEPLKDQFEFLKTALAQNAFKYPDGAIRQFSYIDLRFGKKIFYQLGGFAAPAATLTPATSSPIVQ